MPTAAARRPRPARSPVNLADAIEVARELNPEEPLFCFSRNQLLERLKLFQEGFPGTVSFAVKSNPSKQVLETLAAGGLAHWDVASVQEMAAVRAVADRKSTRLNSSHVSESRMPSSA